MSYIDKDTLLDAINSMNTLTRYQRELVCKVINEQDDEPDTDDKPELDLGDHAVDRVIDAILQSLIEIDITTLKPMELSGARYMAKEAIQLMVAEED